MRNICSGVVVRYGPPCFYEEESTTRNEYRLLLLQEHVSAGMSIFHVAVFGGRGSGAVQESSDQAKRGMVFRCLAYGTVAAIFYFRAVVRKVRFFIETTLPSFLSPMLLARATNNLNTHQPNFTHIPTRLTLVSECCPHNLGRMKPCVAICSHLSRSHFRLVGG